MSKLPYFKFFPQDFIFGTMYMSNSDIGAYIKLLCYQWDQGSLPNDHAMLEKISGGMSDNILSKFILYDGVYKNERLEKERSVYQEKCDKNRANVRTRYERTTNVEQSNYDRTTKLEARSQNLESIIQKSETFQDNACDDKPSRYIPINFELLWMKYPQDRRRNKEKCRSIYDRDCKDLSIENLFIDALDKYSRSKDYQAGFVQLSITWFRDWKTWLDYDVNEELKAKGYW